MTFRSVTIAKVYIGREADALTGFLDAIEWTGFGKSIAKEIADARERDRYHSDAFTLVSETSPDPMLIKYGKVRLPPSFQRSYGQSYVLGPSLVAFVLTFVLDDTESGRVDAALREDAESRIDQVGIGTNPVRTVYQIKSDRVRGIWDKLGGELPGVAGRESSGKRMPPPTEVWDPCVLAGDPR